MAKTGLAQTMPVSQRAATMLVSRRGAVLFDLVQDCLWESSAIQWPAHVLYCASCQTLEPEQSRRVLQSSTDCQA